MLPEIEQSRRRFVEILNRVEGTPESRTPAIAAGLGELREVLSDLVGSTEELYGKLEELLAARESLERSRDLYRELFDMAPDAHIITDYDGQIHLANRAAATLLQVGPNTLVSQSFLYFVGESDRPLVQEQIARLRRGPGVAQHWSVTIRPCQEESFRAVLTVARAGQITALEASLHWVVLHWIIREAPQPPAPGG